MNANNFKAIRLKEGMTQKQFADLLGVSDSTIAAIETGRRPISAFVRARLAQRVQFDDESLYFLKKYQEIEQIYPE